MYLVSLGQHWLESLLGFICLVTQSLTNPWTMDIYIVVQSMGYGVDVLLYNPWAMDIYTLVRPMAHGA